MIYLFANFYLVVRMNYYFSKKYTTVIGMSRCCGAKRMTCDTDIATKRTKTDSLRSPLASVAIGETQWPRLESVHASQQLH